VPLDAPYDAAIRCARCRLSPPAFDAARATWRYAGATQEAIRRFKFHHRWRLGRWLAEEMAATARQTLPLEAIDLVAPVPLHWLKRTLKGFAPAEDLACAVAQRLRKPYVRGALRPVRWTASQSRLQARQRFRNVRGAFAARPRLVNGRGVLLIDDVLTSGATAQACAQALKSAGARSVVVLAAARTPHPGDP